MRKGKDWELLEDMVIWLYEVGFGIEDIVKVGRVREKWVWNVLEKWFGVDRIVNENWCR